MFTTNNDTLTTVTVKKIITMMDSSVHVVVGGSVPTYTDEDSRPNDGQSSKKQRAVIFDTNEATLMESGN